MIDEIRDKGIAKIAATIKREMKRGGYPCGPGKVKIPVLLNDIPYIVMYPRRKTKHVFSQWDSQVYVEVYDQRGSVINEGFFHRDGHLAANLAEWLYGLDSYTDFRQRELYGNLVR